MYTDYVDGEERCRVVARKLIYWVAAITCTGAVIDATSAMDVVRARATTAPFISRPAVVPKAEPTAERLAVLADEFGVEEAVVAPAPTPQPMPQVTPQVMPQVAPQVTAVLPALRPMKLIDADPRFEAALTALAMRPPTEPDSVEDVIPSVPFEGRQLPKPEPEAPVVTPVPPAAPIVGTPPVVTPQVMTPTVELPKLADVPLPRPKPPLTPAQELGLEGKERAKAEQCLAQAIYFEARNEPLRGQIAVAQVVLNRVFSPYYPDTICGVVFQNAHRHLSCQFTFACDGKSEAVRERSSWIRAQRIAKQALDSKVWLSDVAKSTHYHATYVRPHWVREMKKMVRHGQHIFYRPHRWGDGSDEAGWGVASLQTPKKTKPTKHN